MCLGVPGRIVELQQAQGLRMGKVDFGGVCKQVCLEHTPEAQPGDYVIVHVGFSLSVVDADEAQQVFRFVERMNELDDLERAPRPAVDESRP
jgi:hydrogenase expression/formation protein HypC